MDGWMDGWMGGWVDGWIDGWVDGLVHICQPEKGAKVSSNCRPSAL